MLSLILAANLLRPPAELDTLLQFEHFQPLVNDTEAYAPTHRLLVTASNFQDRNVRIWDTHAGLLLRILPAPEGSLCSVACDDDRGDVGVLTTASVGATEMKRRLSVFDPRSGKTVASAQVEITTPRSLEYVSGFKAFAITVNAPGDTCAVALFDSGDLHLIKTFPVEKDVSGFSFSDDGRVLAEFTSGNLTFLDTATGAKVHAANPGAKFSIPSPSSIRFSYSGCGFTSSGQFAIFTQDKALRLFDSHTGALTATQKDIQRLYPGRGGCLLGHFDSGHMTLREGNGPAVSVIDFQRFEATNFRANADTYSFFVDRGHGQLIGTDHGLDLSQDISYSLALFDLRTGRRTQEFAPFENQFAVSWFDPKSSEISSFESRHEDRLRTWDLQTLRQTRNELLPAQIAAGTWAVSPGSNLLLTRSGTTDAALISTVDGQVKRVPKAFSENNLVQSLAVDADGGRIASTLGALANGVRLFDVARSKEVLSFTSPDFMPWKQTQGSGLNVSDPAYFAAGTIALEPDGKGCLYVRSSYLWDCKEGATPVRHDLSIAPSALAYSPDGKVVAAVDRDRVHLLSAKDFSILASSPPGTLVVPGTPLFSPDGKRLMVSAGSTRQFIDVQTLRSQVVLASSSPKGYVFYTQDGYYSSSCDGLTVLDFRYKGQPYAVEQFDIRRNRPDKVLLAMGSDRKDLIAAYEEAAAKRIEGSGLSAKDIDADAEAPEIEILGKDSIPASTDQATLGLRIRAKDPGGKALKTIRVFANGVPVFGAKGLTVQPGDQSDRTLPAIHLEPGPNRVEVSVENASGVESLHEVVDIDSSAAAPKPKLVVLAVGVSKYRNPRYALRYAKKDAVEVYAAFAKSAAYERVDLPPLTDEMATRENILAAKKELMNTATNDVVVLFFAGHGLLSKKLDYFYGVWDIDFSKPEERGIDFDQIESLLDGIPARHRMILMDTCHSGEVDPASVVKAKEDSTPKDPAVVVRSDPVMSSASAGLALDDSFLLMRELFANLNRSSGAIVISASSGFRYAYEKDELQNGVFTRAVLEGLSGGTITAVGLRDYVLDRVRELTNGGQVPTVREESVRFDFRVK